MNKQSRLQGVAARVQLASALLGVGLMVYVAGWKDGLGAGGWFATGLMCASWAYGLGALTEAIVSDHRADFVRKHWLNLSLAALVSLFALFEQSLSRWLSDSLTWLETSQWLLAIAAVLQLAALTARLGEAVPWIERHLFRRFSPGAFLVTAFAFLSFVGAGLLMMPNATTQDIGFLDALFTSFSAVCVTGLIVVDTATVFTPLGQLILLALIQLGGLGIVTLTYFVAMVSGQGVGISSRVFLRDLLNSENLGRLGSAIWFILATTFLCEFGGAFLLYRSWAGLGIEGNLGWTAVFHSISAFCNAGFSVFTDGLADAHVSKARAGQTVIMGLIILGGIGFPVLRILWLKAVSLANRRDPSETKRDWLGVHGKLVLITSLCLWIGGFSILILSSVVDLQTTFGDAAWVALFRTVSARTAGFNISDLGAMSHAGAAVMILLMFIGGSPGGMAGGIKTTTFSVAVLNLLRILRRRRKVSIFRRQIPEMVQHRAFAVVLLSMLWILFASGAIMIAQPKLDFLDTLFETVSAFATVGVSRGITAELTPFSRIVIILTMLIGRVGILNFFLSLLPESPEPRISYPSGNVIVE